MDAIGVSVDCSEYVYVMHGFQHSYAQGKNASEPVPPALRTTFRAFRTTGRRLSGAEFVATGAFVFPSAKQPCALRIVLIDGRMHAPVTHHPSHRSGIPQPPSRARLVYWRRDNLPSAAPRPSTFPPGYQSKSRTDGGQTNGETASQCSRRCAGRQREWVCEGARLRRLPLRYSMLLCSLR